MKLPRAGVRMMGILMAAAAAMTAGAGCADHDRPTEYGRQRPPIDQLDSRDRGLQSADVLKASDQIVAQLLALPELNDSPKRWTLVVTSVEDHTRDRRFQSVDYNIFLDRLKANISEQGRGRLALIENRDRFYDTRNRELERELEPGDEFGQGGGKRPAAAGAPQAISPDFSLYATAADMPNRGTTYYLLNFIVTNNHTREQVFVRKYEVRVSRDR